MSQAERQRALRLARALGLLLFLGLAGLAVRLTWIQVRLHEQGLQRMQSQSTRREVLPARRGSLFDRHGRLLAGDVAGVRPWVLPRNVRPAGTPAEVRARLESIADYLAPDVGLAHDDLMARLIGDRWISLGRAVADPVVIERWESERGGLLRGVDLQPASSRRNPWRALAGNVIGFVDHEARGVAGLEQGLDARLTGTPGERTLRVDHRGRELAEDGLPFRLPQHGEDVTLTLDAQLQRVLEEELARGCENVSAQRGMGVLLDPRTGDVLAMASLPTLDLDDDSQRPRDAVVCGPVQEVYAPGSTLKALMMAAALELGLAHPEEPPVDVSDGRFGGRRIRDTHPSDVPLTLEEILVESSNIGMARLLTRIVPPDRPNDTEAMRPVFDTLRALGFGQRTGVPLPAETAGLVTRLPEWKRNYTLASVSYGQEIGVSALQMAAAASSLADGVRRSPRLVASPRDAAGGAHPSGTRVFRREHVDQVRGWMARSVAEGSCQELIDLGVPIAGKTGTADDEANPGAEVHSYCALVPADDPVLTLVVVIRDPQGVRYSSESAAPTAAAVLRRALPYMGHPLTP